jgi:hypothetical protein
MGAVAVGVAVAVVLGARIARSPDAESTPSSEQKSTPTPADAALRRPASQPDAADALCAEYDPAGRAATNAPDDPYLTATRRRLLVSQSPETLASVAIMAADDGPQRAAAIERAMAVGSQNATVVWAAVQMCTRANERRRCPEWEDALQKLDSENSEVWIRLAASAYERDDTAKALDALRRASTAAETRDYFPETVAMLERALDAAGGHDFPQRVDLAFALAGTNLPSYESYVGMCSKQSKLDAEWAQTCLDYGRLVERQGKTEIGIAIAQSIQFAALEAMGDTGAAENVQARKAARDRANAVVDARGDFFVFGTPRLFGEYLAAMREHGERAALEQARAEGNRLAELCSQQRTH